MKRTMLMLDDRRPHRYAGVLLAGEFGDADEAFSTLAEDVTGLLLSRPAEDALSWIPDPDLMRMSLADLLDGAIPPDEWADGDRPWVLVADGEHFEADRIVRMAADPSSPEPEERDGGEFVSHEVIMRLNPGYYEQ